MGVASFFKLFSVFMHTVLLKEFIAVDGWTPVLGVDASAVIQACATTAAYAIHSWKNP